MRSASSMFARALAVALSVAATACGGTGSETPWPVEPYGPVAGPAAESAPPDLVADAGPAQEPTNTGAQMNGPDGGKAPAAGEGAAPRVDAGR